VSLKAVSLKTVPFEPRHDGAATHEVPIEAVTDLLTVSHAPERIAAYADAMQAGAKFPPVCVVRLAGRLVVADGHKRLAAARESGARTVLIEIWSWRTWAADQRRQAAGNLRKNGRILRYAFTNPREALRLARTTTDHWRRVARSLTRTARGSQQ
jgi:hypothetical protein